MATGIPDLEPVPPRFIVGIDLGTTNSAVAYVDTHAAQWRVENFSLPQLVAPGHVEARDTLPSFHYQPAPGEFTSEAVRLPWTKPTIPSPARRERAEEIVGMFARDHGAEVPGRLVTSAKSWLCHTGVDRTADLLPWHGAADVDRLSPVEVSSRYLAHIRGAWDEKHRQHPLGEQDVVLTLPASFDEVARELTVEAAARAGLPRVVLIEEPQAAFYAWVYSHADDWEQHVSPGQKILVCDIGGGTSDLTLIRVRRDTHGNVAFHRVAVGEHLMLGGDNLDLALAHHLEPKLSPTKLAPRQFDVLVRRCQRLKESLLGDNAPPVASVSVPSAGSKLLASTLTAEITRETALELLLDGFFPRVSLDEKPMTRQSGFQEFGLPYAADPAVTRHVAAFLSAHRNVSRDEDAPTDHDPARPDIVLFNGGLFESAAIRQRMIDVIASWFSGERPWSPQVLRNDRLFLAVARGAAYYGLVRRGDGVKISAELARTYYVAIDNEASSEQESARAVCLMPARAELGEDIELASRSFELLVDQPVEFPLLVSSTRLTDEPGELIEIDREQMKPLPPIRTALQVKRRKQRGAVRVHLHSRLTEIGTLQLWCKEVEGDRQWRLEFDVRSATRTDMASHQGAAESQGVVDEDAAETARRVIHSVFAADGDQPPGALVKELARELGAGRWDWPPSLLRRMWEALVECEPTRRQSLSHVDRWLNLLGFTLRPGYGLALDDWRVAETWRMLVGKAAQSAPAARGEWPILWRRIAGGLSAGQQWALANPQLARLRDLHKRLTTGRASSGDAPWSPRESTETWRLLGTLELLPLSIKIELGLMIFDLIARPKMKPVRGALSWTLGRLGARVPSYGPLNVVVPIDVASDWIRQLIALPDSDPADTLAVMQLARRTTDRYRDIDDELRSEVLEWLSGGGSLHYEQLIRDGGLLGSEERDRIFGESLPKGLRLV